MNTFDVLSKNESIVSGSTPNRVSISDFCVSRFL